MGSFIYLTITRLDIAYLVGVVSQFLQSPQVPHLVVEKRTHRYGKSSFEYQIYKMGEKFLLSGFTEVDAAGDINDRQFTSYYCSNTDPAAVSWCSKIQSSVAHFNTQVEYNG